MAYQRFYGHGFHTCKGFTLIEILVVIVILGILGALVAPNFLSRPDAARVSAAQTDIRTLAAALDVYRLDNFSYPSSEQGLQALVEVPSGFPEPKNWNPCLLYTSPSPRDRG